MVSPAKGWEDRENGLEKGGVTLSVEPVQFDQGPAVEHTMTVAEGDANAYSLSLWHNGGHTSIANFADPKPAWEMLHLLTHYIEARTVWEVKRSSDQFGQEKPSWPPEQPITGLSGTEAIRRFLPWDHTAIEDLLE